MKVLLAMSGGVDSSAAAVVLKEQGHEVVGVTMRLWGGESDTGCCSVSDVDDARRVAQQAGIDHLVFNFAPDFDAHVVEPYVESHVRGFTPNPCIECNRHLKFDRLIVRARELGFDAVATGHHARIITVDGVRRVARGADAGKDQSYVVHMLSGADLDFVMFPIGGMQKPDVIAAATKQAGEAARIADQWLARHDWFAGAAFSFGDIAMGALMWRYLGLDCTRPEMPHLMEWFEALQAREAFRKAVMSVPRAKDPADWNRIEKETA